MHARIAAFENPDMTRTDELVERVRERQSSGAEIPDALGMYLLVDRSAGRSIGISIFESEDAIRAAEPIFARMGDEVPEELRGKRISVETFEVAVHEVAEGATAARVSILAGAPGSIDDGIRASVDDVLPDARALDGWKGVMMLVDRRSGGARIITLWDSMDALAATESQATDLRRRSAQAASQQITGVERYEVAISFDRAPRLVGA